MKREPYLDRIGYKGELAVNLEVLKRLHEQHISRIPFENLDIHLGKEISLDERLIYRKVVENYRGGFCYELNSLFNWLLKEIGFKSKIIAARIFDSEGELGPAFDHMCLLVELDQPWLVDVGFGDLFLLPIALKKNEVQSDGRNYFKVEKHANEEYLLLMSAGITGFIQKYTFDAKAQSVANFARLCQDKQTNPNSYFVKHRICTIPTADGRMTLFNQKVIHRKGEQRFEYSIEGEQHFKEILKYHFNLIIE
jgi:N-hydroxyarylamine O-acetyltransferase